MVVQRRHAENAFAAGGLEVEDLRRNRQGLGDEDAAHDGEDDFLTDDDGDGAERGAERQRADVAHEDLGRVGVEPEEAEAGAGHRAEEDGQFAGTRDVGHQQVLGEHRVAGDVGEDGERTGDHHGRHDRQPVEAVGQVHRVAGADDDEVGEDDETDHAERIGNRLEEGNDQFHLRRHAGRHAEIDGDDEADHRLPEVLPAAGQPLRVAVDDLLPVVVPADGAEAHGHDQHDPDVAVGEVAPEQRGDADGDQDQRAAHGRRAALREVRLRAVLAHGLTDLFGGQPADDARAGGEGDQQRRHRREHGAQRDVVEDVEGADVLRQPLRQHEQHYAFSGGVV